MSLPLLPCLQESLRAAQRPAGADSSCGSAHCYAQRCEGLRQDQPMGHHAGALQLLRQHQPLQESSSSSTDARMLAWRCPCTALLLRNDHICWHQASCSTATHAA
jgi:hypothetical protein